MTQKNEMPEGYTPATGSLPPFLTLGVGEHIHGQLFRVRAVTKSEDVKIKDKATNKIRVEKVDKTKLYFDLTLVEGGKFNMGTVKKPAVEMVEAGRMVTLSGSGGIVLGFKIEAYRSMGYAEYPKGDDAPEPQWSNLYGRKVWIKREKDGQVKKGDFAGNKQNLYTIAFSPAPEAEKVGA